ncbi:MAG: ADP-ribosylation factor-like protein [Promethearchaeota archaeon]
MSYITEKDLELIFLFVTGLTDNFDNIRKELIRCKKEFLNLFEDILQHRFDAKTFEVFDPTIDSIHRNLRPKISLVGFSGVGKTTITRLIKAEEIPMQHIPTITGDIATIKIGKLHFHLWDFAGQEQFSYLWNNFIKGSDAVLLVTDSTLENVEKSKFFLELIKEQAPHAHTAVIGNKQDLEEAINPSQIEKILGLKSYSMIAKDGGNRDKMIQIIADILDMSAEVSPLLKPLLQRDKLTEDAVKALESADFEKSAFLFEKISDLCIELGDDSLGKEFFEKAQKIKTMLKKVGAPQPTPATPLETDTPRKPVVATKQIVPKKPEAPKPPVTPVPKIPDASKSIITSAPKKQEATKATIGPPPEKPEAPKPPISPPSEMLGKPKPQFTPPKSLKTTEAPGMIKEIPLRQEVIIEPKIDKEKVGLKLDPKEFLIKQRPKSVEFVPEDAKTKLKTSPFGHVKNTEAPKTPVPVSPTKLFKEKPRISPPIVPRPTTPNIPQKPITTEKPVMPTEIPKTTESIQPKLISTQQLEPSKITKSDIFETPTQKTVDKSQAVPSMDKKQKDSLKKTLLDLKIKKANLSKMSLDFEMKELTGEITDEELKEKKNKLALIEKKIDEEIKDLQKFLSD